MASSIIVYGPKGCGKTRNSSAIAKAYGLHKIRDDWSTYDPFTNEDTLHITIEPPRTVRLARRSVSFDDAMKKVKF